MRKPEVQIGDSGAILRIFYVCPLAQRPVKGKTRGISAGKI